MPPSWYGTNASYDYHYGVKGHSTKNCLALKRKMQDLTKAGYVNFNYNTVGGPNITSNPLPNHPRPKISALTEDSTGLVKTRVSDVKMPMKNVYEALVLAKILHPEETKMIKGKEQNETVCNQYCQYHANLAGHVIQDCAEFRKRVQDLIDKREIEFLSRGGHSINMITDATYSGNLSPNGPRLITIFHDNLLVKDETSEAPKPVLVIEVPKPFLYKSNKMVP